MYIGKRGTAFVAVLSCLVASAENRVWTNFTANTPDTAYLWSEPGNWKDGGVGGEGDLVTKEVFARVRAGDPDCTEVFRESAEKLATILAYTMDILNPEVIALGGVFMRNADLFMPIVDPILDAEALPLARKACRIVPAELGESIGDYAALAVASKARAGAGKALACGAES